MELKDTVDMMTSDDYKERFKAEFYQLGNRIDKLHNMLEQWDEGKLTFVPTCPRHILSKQLGAMCAYEDALVERARIEGIEL